MKNQQKTVVVLGQARGGTSMVAGALRILGVFMGTQLEDKQHPGSIGAHEDRAFATNNIKKLKQLIRKRNSAYDIWGWKDPFIMKRIKLLAKNLRNPYYIAILRDPQAIQESRQKRQGNKGNIHHFCRSNSNILAYTLRQTNHLILSYEKCLIEPKTAIDRISKFLNITVDKAMYKKAAQFIAPGYRRLQ